MTRKRTNPLKKSVAASRTRRRSKRSEKARKDAEARALVMERDHYACQLQGVGFLSPDDETFESRPLPCSTQIQWCHIKSRRYLSTRWLPENAIAMCAAHHRWSHDNPDEFIGWWAEKYPERLAAVRLAFWKDRVA